MANRVCQEQQIACLFSVKIIDSWHFSPKNRGKSIQIALLPPSHASEYYLSPQRELIDWLNHQHQRGGIIASACAGAFILAATQAVNHRPLTTHWGLTEQFHQRFPNQPLDSDRILIDHGDIISAGGMMSWLDLGLEIVAKYAGANVMRQLGKILVVDTAPREQRYYQQFQPNMTHGDLVILQLQKQINLDYAQALPVSQLAQQAHLSERTLLRRFRQTTGFTPNEYLQRVRIQKACQWLETSQHSFEHIAHLVGYQDSAACRKVFIKIMGLAPRAFRQRFSTSPIESSSD